MAAPTTLKCSERTDTTALVLDSSTRRVTIVATDNDTTFVTIGVDQPVLKQNVPIVLTDPNLAGTSIAFGGTNPRASIFEELGTGS